MLSKLGLNKGLVNLIVIIGSVIVFITLIGFVNKKQYENTCQKIIIDIDETNEKFFIDEAEVLEIINSIAGTDLLGARTSDIRLGELEKGLLQNNFVSEAEVYRDLKGNLRVNISQKLPIARIVSNHVHAYFDEYGDVIPLSDKYTARVVTVTGEKTKEMINSEFLKTKEGKAYLDFFRTIYEDEFWKAQIAEVDINKYGEITIYPQIGQQVLEFGEPVDLDTKFRKLKIFYKKILPAVGWAKYKRVNVKYNKQIVCE
jgi:cell division protein FtsQ